MNCHGDNNQNNSKRHNPIRHMLMMVLCCGLPILLLGVLPFLKIGGGFKALIATVAPFICPLMMIFMIPMMLKGMKKENCCGSKKQNEEMVKIE